MQKPVSLLIVHHIRIMFINMMRENIPIPKWLDIFFSETGFIQIDINGASMIVKIVQSSVLL